MIPTPDEGGFFGRDGDLAQLTRLITADGALVTVVGPPGVGKTRLAAELLRALGPVDHLACDASELRTAEELLERLAELLHVRARDAGPLSEAVADALAERGDLLILVDNFEQMIERAGPVVRALRQAAPRARWLLTSREPLGLVGEWRHEVAPLGIEPGDQGASDAARMLLDRVTRARGTAPAGSERALFERIGARLDGLPLALELAASRIATLGAASVEARLEQQLDVLTRGPRDLDQRQRTLRRAIAWSWELLSPAEQRALAQLSVFRGGFDVAAAEAVVVTDEDALDVLDRLRQKSLLHTRLDEAGHARFGLYLSIREFAAGELGADDAAAAHRRHALHYAELVARTADPRLLLPERDNVFAAIERASTLASRESLPAAARLLIGLAALIDRTPLEPYLDRVEAFLAAHASSESLSPEQRCAIEVTAARGMRRLGRLGDAKRLCARALEAAGAGKLQARLETELGMIAFFEGRLEDALSCWQRSMAIQRQLGDDVRLGLDQLRCGMILRESNRLCEARTVLADALVTQRRAGDEDNRVLTLAELAQIHLELGELDACLRLLDEATRDRGSSRNLLCEVAVLARRAFAHLDRGERAAGEVLAQRALVHVSAIGYRRIEAGLVGYLTASRVVGGTATRPREALEWACRQHRGHPRGTHLFGAWLAHVTAREGALAEARAQFASLPRLSDGDPFSVTSAILRLPLDLPDAAARRARALELGDAHLPPLARRARDSSFDVRLALSAIVDAAVPAPAPAAAGVLEVLADGRAFTFQGVAHDLTRYRTLRRLLLTLVDQRLGSPSAALAWDRLFAAGWPGERAHVEAARNRVKVAVSTLRAMGLRDVLLHDGAGYLLDPAVAVSVVTT